MTTKNLSLVCIILRDQEKAVQRKSPIDELENNLRFKST